MKRLALARFLMTILRLVPKRYIIHGAHEDIPQPFFIFGSGRNGSTLLNQILNQHPSLFLPSEQYFLGNSIIKYQLYNYILWRDLVKIIYGELIQSTGSHSWNFEPSQVITEAMQFDPQQQSLTNLIHHIYYAYGNIQKPGFRIWGDSTPYNTQYAKEIFKCFPKAKFIFLLRDGRDVTAAYKKAGKAIHEQFCEPQNSAQHWLKSIEIYDWLRKKAEVQLIKYENLVSEPQTTVQSITDRLGVDYGSEMLEFHNHVSNVDEYREPHHSNLHKPISTSSVGQWKELLNEVELKAVERLIDQKLERFNYL